MLPTLWEQFGAGSVWFQHNCASCGGTWLACA